MSSRHIRSNRKDWTEGVFSNTMNVWNLRSLKPKRCKYEGELKKTMEKNKTRRIFPNISNTFLINENGVEETDMRKLKHLRKKVQN